MDCRSWWPRTTRSTRCWRARCWCGSAIVPTVAGNGAAAVESWAAARAAGSPYDLVLMDVQMPVMDGLEAARRIRAAETETGSPPTPMLALTANAYAEDRDACLAAGLDGLLVKPLNRERLREALEIVARRASLAA